MPDALYYPVAVGNRADRHRGDPWVWGPPCHTPQEARAVIDRWAEEGTITLGFVVALGPPRREVLVSWTWPDRAREVVVAYLAGGPPPPRSKSDGRVRRHYRDLLGRLARPPAPRVRALREAAGLTQDQLAGACGLTQEHLSGLETGRRSLSSLGLGAAVALARALGVPAEDLLGQG